MCGYSNKKRNKIETNDLNVDFDDDDDGKTHTHTDVCILHNFLWNMKMKTLFPSSLSLTKKK